MNDALEPPTKRQLAVPDDLGGEKLDRQQKNLLKHAKAHLKASAEYLRLAGGNNRTIDLAALAAKKTVELIDLALKGRKANKNAQFPVSLLESGADDEEGADLDDEPCMMISDGQ